MDGSRIIFLLRHDSATAGTALAGWATERHVRVGVKIATRDLMSPKTPA